MTPTVDYLRKRFTEFNAAYFGGRLGEPQFLLSNSRTRLGVFRYKTRFGWLTGRAKMKSPAIVISTYYDMTAYDADNIILHEMIHYYIAANRLRDTAAHGRVFREIADRLNSSGGWDIHVRADVRGWKPVAGQPPKKRDVLVLRIDDGRFFVSVVCHKHVGRIDSEVRRMSRVTGHYWFVCDSTLVADYPVSRTLRGRMMGKEEFDSLAARLRGGKAG